MQKIETSFQGRGLPSRKDENLKPNPLNSGIGAESLIDSLRTGCSVFHITGHHRMKLEPGNRCIGNYLLAGERQSSVAESGSGNAGTLSSTHRVLIAYSANKTSSPHHY